MCLKVKLLCLEVSQYISAPQQSSKQIGFQQFCQRWSCTVAIWASAHFCYRMCHYKLQYTSSQTRAFKHFRFWCTKKNNQKNTTQEEHPIQHEVSQTEWTTWH